MKTNVIKICSLILVALSMFLHPEIKAQSVFNPSDPVVTYNAATPPSQPTFGQMGKWVRKKRLNWDTDSYKAYVYKGFPFRLKFPKSYDPNANDGKKYPVFVFYHGVGEGNKGDIYDNEFQLYHGGQQFKTAVDNGTFDGFILVGQSGSSWGGNGFPFISDIIDYLIANNKADPFRVINNGLSGGGQACWISANLFPTYYAAVMPMSSAELSFQGSEYVNKLKYTAIWNFQGGLDGSPAPGTAQTIRNTYLAAGSNYSYTEYPTLAHGIWNTVWQEPTFWPFVNKAYKANPWPLNGKAEFCANDQITATLGLTPGFNEYQWRKDGVIIANAISNTITVTALGTYDARVKRGSNWSEWSKVPVVLKMKDPTVPPDITTAGIQSKVLPTLGNGTGVNIEVPAGYANYLWQSVGSSTTLGTDRVLNVVTPGEYRVRVTENFGCSSEFSLPFKVVDANGPNKPAPASNLQVTTSSKTTLKLDWIDTPNPPFDETNFEIYQATVETGPYVLIALTNANVLTYTATGLDPGVKYFFKIRAVNATGAATTAATGNGTTDFDAVPPTAPTNLVINSSTQTSISLTWTAAFDDVGVEKYDIYINGVKSYVTSNTQFVVYNLDAGNNYNFTVKARDLANNSSPSSNQVSGQARLTGLPYKYYTFTGTWNNLPNFATLTPVSTGVMPGIALTPRTQNDNFAFLWEGFINIPTSGTYYFRTNSDDGSKLWLGAQNGTSSPYTFSGSALVNNDGLHGGVDATSAAITLNAGVYPIAIAYYEQGGGESMTVSWRTPASGTSYSVIPSSVFADPVAPGGTPPAAPSGLQATAFSSKQINLSWVDNSNNETGFEIWRSTSVGGQYLPVGVAAANATIFADTALIPATTYYYRLRSIGQYGESGYIDNVTPAAALWKLNNNYSDASGNNKTLTQTSNPTFDAADKKEGSHAVVLNGTNQYMSIPTSGSFLQTTYTQKTILMWVKSSNNTGNRFLLDIGANDDGLGLRLDGNLLYAGIASNNTRRNFNVSYTSTDWMHIALVYNVNSLKLYINGAQAASNDALGFNSVTGTSGSHRIGFGDGSSGNVFQTASARFMGKLDDVGIYDKALSPSEITTLMNGGALAQSFATTLAAPAVPNAPTGLTATGSSSSSIHLTWNDLTTETGYQLFRSTNNNGNYTQYKSFAADVTSFSDTGLFGNTIFFYKIRAINEGGNSSFSNEDSAKTTNDLPAIALIGNKFMRHGTQLVVNVSATDNNPEALTLQVSGLPGFGTFTSDNLGNGEITFNPTSGDMGNYNLTVQVTDENSGSSSVSFTLNVNDNHLPVIANVTNVVMNELQSQQISVSASDQNGSDVLSWSFIGLPSFAIANINGPNAQLVLSPGYADNGVYQVTAIINDGNDGEATKQFTITVNDANPNKKTFVNFNDGTTQAPAPWYNVNKNNPALGNTFTNINDETGAPTGMTMQIMTQWLNIGNGSNNLGVNTGNNSGVYPDVVMASAYYTTSNATQTIRISGLTAGSKYNFTFFGSRTGVNDNRTSVYTINGSSVSLNAASNSQNTVSLNNVIADANGILSLNLQAGAGAAYGYLNAMVIESVFDDGSSPARPRDLAASMVSGGVNLTWTDAAYNETGYQIYRSTNINGPFNLINSGTSNTENLIQYTDGTILGSETYYYTVRAVNLVGNSPYTDTVSISAPNVSPTLNAISDVSIKTQQTVAVTIVATDDPADNISLSVTNLPSFATFVSSGGTGTITITPGDTKGIFSNIVITATDNHGASTTKAFSITVVDKDVTKMQINFNAVMPAASPWNNFNALPTAGRSISGIVDNSGAPTAVSVTLVDGWDDANNVGATTGNNSGIYPDAVMQTAYWTTSTTAKRIRISGLSTAPGLKYNLVFFASRGAVGDNRNSVYTYSGQSVTLNAANNTSNTVQISGVVPNAAGQIEFSVTRGAGSAFAYINALVIESYSDNGMPLAPDNLIAAAKSKTSIQLNWADKSSTEEGFEIYRSISSGSGYSLLTTTAANATSYVDATAQSGILYYYKVRAKKSPNDNSAYSNVAATSTFNKGIYVNFNDAISAGNPWNNTNRGPVEDDVYPNLKNENLNPTGINMSVVGKGFSGTNPFGMVTGNNSGVYPDNVISSTWWLDIGGTGILKIDGLNQAQTYSFTFFASRDGGGSSPDRTTVYRIGDKVTSLNAINNINQTATISGVKADGEGSILITINAGGTSTFGYIGAMVIESYTSAILSANEEGQVQTLSSKPEVTVPPVAATMVNEVAVTSTKVEEIAMTQDKLLAYPNPFADVLVVKLNLAKPETVATILISDITGRIVLRKAIQNVPKGESSFVLPISSYNIPKGTYILTLKSSTKVQSLKILKR